MRFLRARPSVLRGRGRLGFTLLEMVVTTAIAAVAIAAAFAFTEVQIKAFSTQSTMTRMHASSRVVLDAMSRDLQNVGFGSSFFLGAPPAAMGGQMVLSFPSSGPARGMPYLMMADNIPASDANAMAGSDALFLFRLESLATAIPATGTNVTNIPGTFVATRQFAVQDGSVLQRCATEKLMILAADMGHGSEPSTMLLALNQVYVDPNPGATAANLGDWITFGARYDLDPAASGRTDSTPTASHVNPKGVGTGALLVCVSPVTYWVDKQARLRLWQLTDDTASGIGAYLSGTSFGKVPINPATDAILAEGVETLQVALFMSQALPASASALRGNWAFSTSALAIGASNLHHIAETRAVRVSAVMRTSKKEDSHRVQGLGAGLENYTFTGLDNRYHRRVVAFQAELKNLRVFDALSTRTRTTDNLRSFLP